MDAKYDKYWELIVQVLSDEAGPEEKQELQDWLDEAPEHRYIFEKVSRLFEATNKAPVPPVFDRQAGWTSFLHHLRKRRFRRLVISLSGVAAILILSVALFFLYSETPVQKSLIQPGSAKAILIVGNQAPITIDRRSLSITEAGNEIRNDSAGGLVFQNKGIEKTETTYSTLVIPLGGEYKITLPDGTQVWLNSQSELRFPSRFAKDCRLVELKGEGYFKVAKENRRPFLVKTTDAEIKVYGTEFNLHAYEEEKELTATLVNGSISVTPTGREEMKILPSQQLSYFRETRGVSVREVDTELYTSWKDGFYSFENTSLGEIFNYLKRWYMLEVSYTEPSLKEMRFTGAFQKDRPIGYGLNLIRLTCEVNFKIDGNHILVQP